MRGTILLGICALPLAVNADQGPEPAWGIYAALRVVSDYRFNGTSVSDADPSLQGYVHLQHKRGWYAGAFASSVDFNDPGTTRGELDLYAGHMWNFRTCEIRAELMHLSFDEQVPGPTYDFWQGKLILRKHFASGWLGASAAFTPEAPYAGGHQAQIKLEAQTTLREGIRLTGMLGRGIRSTAPDYSYVETGLEMDLRKVTIMVGWTGNDLDARSCLDPSWCRDTWISSITLRSW